MSTLAPPLSAKTPSEDDYVAGVLAGDRAILSRAITLIESSSRTQETIAQAVLQRLLPHIGGAKRVGITGAPGVGKSTFIEALGCHLVEHDHKVAVLAIDPSSIRSGGSILGDKTRMERLSTMPDAFIRPSPSGDNLGGVARRTRETMLLCEAAGFDTILVESVGVGQAEVALRSMVDFFALLLIPGAGDELQAIKKGIVEMADAILINKADGANLQRAQQACGEQRNSLHYVQPATPGWKTDAALASALTGTGICEFWKTVEAFYSQLTPNGVITRRRHQQSLDWLNDLIRDELPRRFYQDARVIRLLASIRESLLQGQITAFGAAEQLVAAHLGKKETP